MEHEPEAIWPFVLKWGSQEDGDVRAAIATCLLGHLLEYHFDLLFARVEEAARGNVWFAKTTAMCRKFGDTIESKRSVRFDNLLADLLNIRH